MKLENNNGDLKLESNKVLMQFYDSERHNYADNKMKFSKI